MVNLDDLDEELSEEYYNILIKYQYDLNKNYNKLDSDNSKNMYEISSIQKKIYKIKYFIFILLILLQIFIILLIIVKSYYEENYNNIIIFFMVILLLGYGVEISWGYSKFKNIRFSDIFTKLPTS